MHKWILTWILPTLFYRSYFYLIFLVGALSLACNDMNPEQMATNVNCSSPERHTRSYDYMEGGNVRVRRLFCRTQWYVKIDKRGKIKGVRDLNSNYTFSCYHNYCTHNQEPYKYDMKNSPAHREPCRSQVVPVEAYRTCSHHGKPFIADISAILILITINALMMMLRSLGNETSARKQSSSERTKDLSTLVMAVQ